MCTIEQEQRRIGEEDQARAIYFAAHHVFQMKELLKCSICFEVFDEPTSVFNCFHVFCEECIQTHLSFSTVKEPPCPICQKGIPRNHLRTNICQAKAAKFVTSALEQINTILDCNVTKLPSFQTILTRVRQIRIVELPMQDQDSESEPIEILKARKVLIGLKGEVVSIPVCRDGSVKTPVSNKRHNAAAQSSSTKKKIKNTSDTHKDLFDLLKESPAQNSSFIKNKLNLVTKTYSAQKQPKKAKNLEPNVVKINHNDDNPKGTEIVNWLHDSRNKFDSKPQSQENLVPELQNPDFDMPSISQLPHKCKRGSIPTTEINKQELEENKIRQKNKLLLQLNRTNLTARNKHSNGNRQTRSLDYNLRTKPNLKMKRKQHSFSTYESSNQNAVIEQFNSEEEVILMTGILDKPTDKTAIVNLMEKEFLNSIDIEMQQKQNQSNAKQMEPKRSKRIAAKKHKPGKKDQSSGWTRIKEIKKTIGKTERKPRKLKVDGVARCCSVVAGTSKQVDCPDKTSKKDRNKNNLLLKVGQPVVLLETLNLNKISKIRAETNSYDLDFQESLFEKINININDLDSSNNLEQEKPQTPNKDETKLENNNKSLQPNFDTKKEETWARRSFPISNLEVAKEVQQIESTSRNIKECMERTPTNKSEISIPKTNKIQSNDTNLISKPITSIASFVKNTKISESTSNPNETSTEKEQSSSVQVEKKTLQLKADLLEDKLLKIIDVTSISSNLFDSTDIALQNKNTVDESDDELFMKPTQVMGDQVHHRQEDICEDAVFNRPTQPISNNVIVQKTDLKPKIQSLHNILNKLQGCSSQSNEQNSFIAIMKSVLNDTEQMLNQIQTNESNLLMKHVNVQTDVAAISSYLSPNSTTQTVVRNDRFKHVAIQTNSCDSSKGFRISATEMFRTQPTVTVEVQTDDTICPNCNYRDLIKLPSDVLARDSAIIKNLSEKYVMSESFDIDFETQEIIKGKQIKGLSSESVKNKHNKENCNSQNTMHNKNQTPATGCNDMVLKTTQNSQICRSKKTFKRIRRPSSGSDSDSNVVLKNVKRNKFVQDELSLHFASQVQTQLSPVNRKISTEESDGYSLSPGSQGINYKEYLDNVLKKCDEELQGKKRPSLTLKNSPQKDIVVEPPAKQSKTQDMIKECEKIIQEACSDAIRIEHTENYSNNLQNNSINRNLPAPTKLSLADLEAEFGSSFSSEEVVKKDSEGVDSKIESCNSKEKKFSDSLFTSTDNFTKNVSLCEILQQPNSELEIKIQSNTKAEELMKASRKQLTKQHLHKLLNMNDSFDDEINAEVATINDSTCGNKNKSNHTEKVRILQNITIFDTNLVQASKDIPELISPHDVSDDIFLSDSDIVETTPQKTKQHLSSLSQLYYNQNLCKNLSPVDQVISSLDPPQNSHLSETFTPPVEFQDFSDDKTMINKKDDEQMDVTLLETANKMLVPSYTPDLLFPQIDADHNDRLNHEKEPIITSTPYMEGSQVISARSLNISPITVEDGLNHGINPILAAHNSKYSPLTIVKSVTSPPHKPSPLSTSTPKQRSILSYVRPPDNLNNSQSSQLSMVKKKPLIACTRMSIEQVLAITSLSNRKLVNYTTTFSAAVTHMVVDVDDNNYVRDHTMKYVSAVAAGIWVVGFRWVEECLKQNRLVPEEEFEALDVKGVAGPKKSRLTRITQPLLKGYKIHVAPPFQSTTAKEVEDVVKLVGGEVVPRPDDLLSSNDKVCLIITEADSSQEFDLYEMWLETLKIVTVDIEWLSLSVGKYETISFLPYILCSDSTVCDLGYPPELIVEEPSSLSHTTLNH